ncbi:putative nuclease HARBI1 [Morone saxatilis]|uniref:putative nuclease HARBI1 n=1 Tax=Morone saxatilis TaxID=34816 RepID=UPI0015E23C35|nr:putative nuclease HARBI1 [Morone saxatilis]
MDPRRKRLLAVSVLQHRLRDRRRRRSWVRETNQARLEQGEFHRLVRELRLDGDRFQNHFRLSVEQFDGLLLRVGPLIRAVETNYRKPISPSQRLSICLRYLASGESCRSVAHSYRVGVSTVCGIVRQVSQAIWDCLQDDFMPVPGEADWRAMAEDYMELRNFPNCVGAVDCKHVVIQAPANSGSLYRNYKGSFSIVLTAVVDARYRFRLVDLGACGGSSDGDLSNSVFGQTLRTATLSLPPDRQLPGAEHLGPLPHVLVGDEALPLLRNLMRPYPGASLSREQRLYNQRLSQARRVADCVFSRLASEFRIFQQVIRIEPVAAELAVRAACILHNFMRWDLTEDISADGAGEGLLPVQRLQSEDCSAEAASIRNRFAEYLSSPAGAQPGCTVFDTGQEL